ncbi:MAG: hypothetical protein PHU27_02860 [Salinivirgaceae bacterium]|nr:hypothetical protein [Salinivirgaceae bacterium]MDD4748237.1 hypothetical protein [Salinivirgaceae bacterium]
MSRKFYVRARAVPYSLLFQMLYGRTEFLIGFILLIIALPLLTFFLSIVKLNPFNDVSPTTNGVVTNIYGTNSFVGDDRIYQFFYTFTIDEGQEKTGSSFSQETEFQIGDTVSVLFENQEPFNSVIVGMRTGRMEPWIVLVVLPFLFSGLIFIGASAYYVNKEVQLLKYGRVAFGTFITKESTNKTSNLQPVYNLYFQFNAHDGKTYASMCSTHLPCWSEGKEEEKLVYDPGNPEKTLLISSLPMRIRTFFNDAM